MTHITVTVAIPAEVNPGPELYEAVSAALDPFDENLEVETYVDLTAQQIANDTEFQKFWLKLTEEKPAAVSFAHAVEGWWGGQLGEDGNLWSTCNPEGRWDWWVIGGRWAGQWVLKPGATRALAPQRSAFGFTEESKDPRRTDAARKAEIEPTSIAPSYAYIGLDGQWHQQGHMGWFATAADQLSAQAWAQTYTEWMQSLPADTWLVKVDAHL
ncbi:MAG: hypothetical protein O2892_10750 [Actinomycetota bacterium]|nr:hypothetical protein [Actinomycetota bacterium]MDA2949506.1 hypothetical protein [Actinomycetota bacterium]